MNINITDPIFHDEDKARDTSRGRTGRTARSARIAARERTKHGGKRHVRPLQCNACREQFTVTVGTIMEDRKSR